MRHAGPVRRAVAVVGLVDREKQIAALDRRWSKHGPALALVYGRRRVGKTYFLRTYLQSHRGVYFLAASTSAENLGDLLHHFRRAFPERADVTLENYPTWRVVFRLLSDLARDGPLIVVIDEFGSLTHADASIPSVLQAVWDQDAPASRIKLVRGPDLVSRPKGTGSRLIR